MNLSRRSLFRALAGAVVGRAAQRVLPASNVRIAVPPAFYGRGTRYTYTGTESVAAILKTLWPPQRIETLVWDPRELLKKLAPK